MIGVCECGHVDSAHFDEVLACSSCECERFKDRNFVRCPARTHVSRPWRCTLPVGHEDKHVTRGRDGVALMEWEH